MSIFDFDKYHIIAAEGLGRAMMYLVKIILIFALVVSGATVIKVSQLLDQGAEYLSNNVPNFYFENNQFVLESNTDVTLENHEYTDFRIILTNSETYSEETIKDFDGLAVVFTKNHILMKQQNSTSITTQTYEEIAKNIDLTTVNKDYIINIAKGENAYTVLANIFAVIFISTFLKKTKKAMSLGIGIVFLSYFMQIIGGMGESIEWIKKISLFEFASSRYIVLHNHIHMTYLWVGIGIIIACIIGTYCRYEHKEFK